MDAVKFLQERARMCNSFSPDCEGCRVDEEKPVMSECYLWMFENPERAVKIVEEVMENLMQNIASGLWIVLGVYIFFGIRKWSKRFSELYDELKEEVK